MPRQIPNQVQVLPQTTTLACLRPSQLLKSLFRVVVLGLILSVVMGAANVYVGLKAGMTVFRLNSGGSHGDATVQAAV